MTGPGVDFSQLALDFRWDQSSDLACFVAQGNQEAVAAVEALETPHAQWLFFSGPADCGKTHLLHAACAQRGQGGQAAVYVSLAEHGGGSPALLEGLEHMALVAIDDLHEVAGRPDWEEAIFHTYNRLRDAGGQLMVAADRTPAGLEMGLPDLVSRLQAMLSLRLTPPDDERRRRILEQAARRRGLHLPPESVNYLLSREARDLSHLMALMDRLDAASLRSARRLTVPFIRGVLAG